MEVDALRSTCVAGMTAPSATKRTGSSRGGGVRTAVDLPKNGSSMTRIIWSALLFYTIFHAGGLYGFYLTFTSARLLTSFWGMSNLFTHFL